MNYSLFNQIWKADELNMSKKQKVLQNSVLMPSIFLKTNEQALENLNALKVSSQSTTLQRCIKSYSIGNHTGEGWFLTGEMIELLNNGVKNIVCLQPFGCLPNHIVGKGMLKELRRQFKGANISPIDYDQVHQKLTN